MSARIGNIVIGAPCPEALAGFCCRLLGMRVLRRSPDRMVIGHEGARPHPAFDGVPAAWQRPRWPDPAYPQQMHLDIG